MTNRGIFQTRSGTNGRTSEMEVSAAAKID